jgi:DNA-binding response OmpR family regulator
MTHQARPQHLALIVEDDPRMAEMMAEIAQAAGCNSKIVDNRDDALSLFRSHRFCLVLLDLSVKISSDAMSGNTAHGRSVLRELRLLSEHHTGKCWWLPIIVISGHLRERDEAVHVMREGAAAIIDKPFEERVLTELILAELHRCGRKEHSGCQSRPLVPAVTPDNIQIRLPGTRVGRKTVVYLGEGRAELSDAELKTLLRLIAAGKKGVHKNELGKQHHTGFQAVSRLQASLRPALGDLKIIENDHHGTYSLARAVRVVHCDVAAHAAIGDAVIDRLLKQIGRRRASSPRR